MKIYKGSEIYKNEHNKIKYSSILEALSSSIFSIKKMEDGTYKFTEQCDNFYKAFLTKEQFRELIKEMVELL